MFSKCRSVFAFTWTFGVLLPSYPAAAAPDPRPIVTVDVALAETSYLPHYKQHEREFIETTVRRGLIEHLEEQVGFLRFAEADESAAADAEARLELRIGMQDGKLPRPVHLHVEIDGPRVRCCLEQGNGKGQGSWTIRLFDIGESLSALPSAENFAINVVEAIQQASGHQWVEGVFRLVVVAEEASGYWSDPKWFWRLPFTLAQIRARAGETRFRVRAFVASNEQSSGTHDAEAACKPEPSAPRIPCWASSGKALAIVTAPDALEDLKNAEDGWTEWIKITQYSPPPPDSAAASSPVLGGKP